MLATFVLFYCNNYTAMYMHICISCLHTYCIVDYFWGCNFFTNLPISYNFSRRKIFMKHFVIYCF